MEIIYFIIPLALGLLLVSVLGFFWAVKRGQFDDLDTPGYRVLTDDGVVERPKTPDENKE